MSMPDNQHVEMKIDDSTSQRDISEIRSSMMLGTSGKHKSSAILANSGEGGKTIDRGLDERVGKSAVYQGKAGREIFNGDSDYSPNILDMS